MALILAKIIAVIIGYKILDKKIFIFGMTKL